jgi:hypothetical protein
MPVSVARSAMLRGRPPLGLGGSGGKSGAMIVHNVSLINVVLMPQICHAASGSVRRGKSVAIEVLSFTSDSVVRWESYGPWSPDLNPSQATHLACEQ